MTTAQKQYAAELLGAFMLTFAVLMASSGAVVLPVALVAAITLGLFVYTVGSISGAHLNPAVTIAMFSLQKIELKNAIGYIVSQMIGAWLAIYVASFFFVHTSGAIAPNMVQTYVAEAIGTFMLAFGVSAVVYKKVSAEMSGVVVGASLLLGGILAAKASGGVLNPAVALGLGSFTASYILGPVIGALLGAQVFRLLND